MIPRAWNKSKIPESGAFRDIFVFGNLAVYCAGAAFLLMKSTTPLKA